MRQRKYPGPPPPKKDKVTPLEVIQWFTTREAADYLRTSVGSIHNMVYRRQLEYFKRLGRLLFRRDDLDRLILRVT